MTFIFFSTLAIKVKFEKKNCRLKLAIQSMKQNASCPLQACHSPYPSPPLPTPDISLLVSRRFQVDKAPAARSRIKNQGLKIID